MIKRVICFSNPIYLSKKDNQLKGKYPDNPDKEVSVPIEDIGCVVLDNQQITITQGLLAALLDNNAAVVSCDEKHMPDGLFLVLASNHVQSERFKAQLEAKVPLKKQLWQQTVSAKIHNQAVMLKRRGRNAEGMFAWSRQVKSGDTGNLEARAAAHYWKNFFPPEMKFYRERFGVPPNNILNYGYAILRAFVARGLVSSGLLPTLGIHHHNKYNAYCLADDIMEPYRPFVDSIVANIVDEELPIEELTPQLKARLLSLGTFDMLIEGESSPLMVGLQQTTASLFRCFEGTAKEIKYPTFLPMDV